MTTPSPFFPPMERLIAIGGMRWRGSEGRGSDGQLPRMPAFQPGNIAATFNLMQLQAGIPVNPPRAHF